jgi:hypothetical protein
LKYRYPKTALEGDIGDFTEPIKLLKVDETKWESFWDSVVREHHYLGYVSAIGSRLKYLITLGTMVVGAISFCSAVYKLGPRDKFVGWDESTRLALLPHLVYNNRFLIFPWIKVRNLASHVLSLSLKRLRLDRNKQYEVEPYMVETFVDNERFTGTCYVASNWIRLGETKGFGRLGNGFVFHGRLTDIYVKVLNRRFAKTIHPDVSRIRDERKDFLTMIEGIPMFYPRIIHDLGVTKIDSEIMTGLFTDHLKRYLPYLTRVELVPHFTNMLKGCSAIGSVNRSS